MMVTFVAECEKKALNKTRRVLDAFANRVGTRTWQTVITADGLKAVKKLLRKTATKNSAISCHWIRSRSRSELLWIVGNRSKFNNEGFVPVNYTEQNIFNTQWENDWHYLPLIKSLTGLAGLFHDWGKSSEFFQTKLRNRQNIGDPVRHEWLSVLFLNTFVAGESDEQWLTRLANGEITLTEPKQKNKPLANLPPCASLLCWLIVSHHRLPLDNEYQEYWGDATADFSSTLSWVTSRWGYENRFAGYVQELPRCFDYSQGLPFQSEKWLSYAKNCAKKLKNRLGLLEKSIVDGSWRLVLYHSRLALMLGDHYHSSLDNNPNWPKDLDLYANTDRATGKLKQKLTEHLLGVAKQGIRNAHMLPAFEGKHAGLDRAYDVKILSKKSPANFRWQDKGVEKINKWRGQQGKKLDSNHFGFFVVNMASTGKGKTFANAKIMRALSPDQESLRYILALGLRTLTLQTGDEYRQRIGLGEDELAVLIGSKAVLDLHNNKHQKEVENTRASVGSESSEGLLENELVFTGNLPEKELATIITDLKSRKFLYAPVLSCTIDHLMAATETRRGGRYILPSLRLMSSDLVIDEIDDFDGTDLIAIGRLIHLAGMLGRKVMISSATIPPDLAEGYFNAYQAGWRVFATMREKSPIVGCGWVDEFGAMIEDINCVDSEKILSCYQDYHQQFIKKRLAKLAQQIPKRQAEILPCPKSEDSDTETIWADFCRVIKEAILAKHKSHHTVDRKTGKKVSFGVVRVANIKPCLDITKYLLSVELPHDVEVRTMAYHSQQILIMRNAQEKHLDAVLKRDQGDDQSPHQQSEIRKQLDTISTKHVIFVLVATPVEEVGRDHDFDWAIVEPSSYRSFIQLAGRVRRHRPAVSSGNANMGFLQYNLKGLIRADKPVFCYPGYESRKNALVTHNLYDLVDGETLKERLDAKPRISKRINPTPQNNLADLEHEVIRQLLTSYQHQGPESLQGWLTGCWWLTAIPQACVRFRAGHPQLPVFLAKMGGVWKFVEKVKFRPPVPIEESYSISREELTDKECQRLWLYRNYEELLVEMGVDNIEKKALIYGEIGLPTYGKDPNGLSFVYNDQLGLVAK